MAVDKKFFEEQRDQSEVKARIVAKYFDAWSKVMLGARRKHGHFQSLAYIDLFAGPGRYSDGAKSTPLLVLERAIANPDLCESLVTLFNDKDSASVQSLATAIETLPGIEKLRHRPQIHCSEIDRDAEEMFRRAGLRPTFSFVDPFGYKGLSRGFIQSMIRDWGCDCVFFFNYNRINAGLNNDAVRVHMDALFGHDRIEEMRETMRGMKPWQREAYVLEQLALALRALGARYVLPFRFRRDQGNRTSHELVFVSKSETGYTIMKDIMAKESSTEDEGVPSFEYSPADERTPLLFSLQRPLSALGDDLLKTFAGRTMTMSDVYHQHHVDTPFLDRNYKRVLTDLEAASRVTADPPASKRRKHLGQITFADSVRVSFPAGPG